MKALALVVAVLALARCLHHAGEPRSPLLIQAAAPVCIPPASHYQFKQWRIA